MNYLKHRVLIRGLTVIKCTSITFLRCRTPKTCTFLFTWSCTRVLKFSSMQMYVHCARITLENSRQLGTWRNVTDINIYLCYGNITARILSSWYYLLRDAKITNVYVKLFASERKCFWVMDTKQHWKKAGLMFIAPPGVYIVTFQVF